MLLSNIKKLGNLLHKVFLTCRPKVANLLCY